MMNTTNSLTWEDADYPSLIFTAKEDSGYVQVTAREHDYIVLILEVKGLSLEQAKNFTTSIDLNPLMIK